MKLLTPLKSGRVDLKNRLMFPPLTTGYEGRDGSITEQSIAFYQRLAKGGVGYIVVGDVNPVRSFSPTPRLHDDSQIEGFRRLADAVHQHGAKIAAQIFHPEYDVAALGALAAKGDMAAVRQKMHHDMEHFTDEVSETQLLEILARMVACARRVQAAGFDCVQIHGDRLLGALCSRHMNHRQDQYGGSLENRTRYARMVVRALREALPDLAIDYKLSVTTPQRGRGGVEQEEAVQFAQWLEEDGVDMLHVAQANHTGNMADTIPPMGVQPYGFFLATAGAVRGAVGIPVSAVGRIIDPQMAERVLAGGMADVVGIGRPLLCDPDWGVKLADGQPQSIRRCICCNKGCTDAIQNRAAISCVLNAENGNELTRAITPASATKRVAVVGGGPAGLEAARVAALRGHAVTLYERTPRLGGQLNLAAVPPRKDELRRATADLERAAAEAGAQLRTGCTADQDLLLTGRPDAVLVAVGAANAVPPIPGADGATVCDAWAVLSGAQIAYGRVVVIGGGLVGCETAEYLAQQGCQVTVVEMLEQIATGESTTVLPTLMDSFRHSGVAIHTKTTVQEITAAAVRCADGAGQPLTLPCDTVVMAAGARPVPFPTERLEAAGIPVIRLGDCDQRASDISNAIRTAYDAACAL